MSVTPLLALTLGDPSGIGPEVCLEVIEDPAIRSVARLVLIGPEALRPPEVPALDPASLAGLQSTIVEGGVGWIASAAPAPWRMGEIQEAGGRAALAALKIGHELAYTGAVDALVTAPVCKEALHLAGQEVEGQTELLGQWCAVDDHQMLAIAGKLRVMLLTRHLPLREALEAIDTERVLRHLRLLHSGLVELGFQSPRLALAGLNPHAGENSLLGLEEAEILEPAVHRAKAEGLDVSGPVSPDALFVRAAGGDYDGVLALYHDQAFIPIKLLGEGRGMTVLIGLPYLRLSPAHGVAFDLAGRGEARSADLGVTILQAAEWCLSRKARV